MWRRWFKVFGAKVVIIEHAANVGKEVCFRFAKETPLGYVVNGPILDTKILLYKDGSGGKSYIVNWKFI